MNCQCIVENDDYKKVCCAKISSCRAGKNTVLTNVLYYMLITFSQYEKQVIHSLFPILIYK